jgi:hypothetical protein
MGTAGASAYHPIAEIQTGTLPAIRRKPDPLRRSACALTAPAAKRAFRMR